MAAIFITEVSGSNTASLSKTESHQNTGGDIKGRHMSTAETTIDMKVTSFPICHPHTEHILTSAHTSRLPLPDLVASYPIYFAEVV